MKRSLQTVCESFIRIAHFDYVLMVIIRKHLTNGSISIFLGSHVSVCDGVESKLVNNLEIKKFLL